MCVCVCLFVCVCDLYKCIFVAINEVWKARRAPEIRGAVEILIISIRGKSVVLYGKLVDLCEELTY